MIRRFFARLVIAVLLAACGGLWWRTHQLERQVAQLQAQLLAVDHQAAKAQTGRMPAEKQGWLDKADFHAGRAREAAVRGDLRTAQREWDRSVDDLQRAVTTPEVKTKKTLTRMRQKLAAWQTQANALWKKAHPTGGGTP